MDSESFDPDLNALLEPAAADAPCGPPVRYEPAYLQLRQSREEDDASLPMREWERPLKRADWRAIAANCTTMLAQSKDLQLAAWLMDAWVRLHQVRGFVAGARVLTGLVERYWEGMHPRIEDGDAEARIAAFVWLNENIPVTLRLHVPMVFVADRKPPFLNYADWERLVSPPVRGEASEDGITRDSLVAMVDSGGVRWLVRLRDELGEAIDLWESLSRALDDKLAADAPSLAKVSDALKKMQRACVSLLDGRGDAKPVAAAPEAPPMPIEQEEPMMIPEPVATPSAADAAPLPSGPITNRQDAYRMLEAAATFLQRTEPHSPTPYLVRRAVTWGQMSLPDLMQEVLREEGDIGRFFSMLGINLPRD